MTKRILLSSLAALALLLAGCGSRTPERTGAGGDSGTVDSLLEATPQDLTFQTPEGRTLQGRYFPAAVENAPVVVLVHWILANQDDWQVVATWLQNRGQELPGTCSLPVSCSWWDSSWFPPIGERTFAVFTYTLSGCESSAGCTSISREAWVEDANAALLYASQLEGVDPGRMVTAGASIGADAAIDSCTWLNQQGGTARCLGTVAFSPGNYLGLDYADQVVLLEASSLPAWCLYAEGDVESALACRSASGRNFQRLEYDGSDHGMKLIQPDLKPMDHTKTTLDLFLDFLDLTLGP